jgi:Lysyl oxidase
VARLARLLRPLLVLLLAAALLLPSAAGSATVARDLLPDLVTRTPAKIFVQVGKHGRRVVRFSNEVVNVGIGPLELRPRVGDCNHNGNLRDDRTSFQRIYRDTDGDSRFTRNVDRRFRTRPAGCTRFHPAHKHWHFEALAEYVLNRLDTPESTGPIGVAGKKVSSCVLDTKRRLPNAPGSPRRKYYGSCRRDSVGGISIGWGDIYGSRIIGQELEISALADGAYCLVSRADPENRLLESSERNNRRTTRIVLRGDEVDWRPQRPC